MDQQTQQYKSGFVAVMGKPNVGKSTLLNRVLGQKIAAVSPKPQTTRMQQFGILSLPEAQMIFIDTPGLHQPHHKLGEFMNKDALHALEDADLVLLIVDGTEPLHPQKDRELDDLQDEMDDHPPLVIAVNKIDKLSPGEIEQNISSYQNRWPHARIIPVSASRGDNLDNLIGSLLDHLPEGPRYFDTEQITDLYERDIASDLIRAAAMTLLRDEVPHAIAVRIDEYQERDEHGAYIAATLFVERESQKAIVIGKGGKMIKLIGSLARKEIEEMSGRKIFLKLRVKVRKNWRNDQNALRLFGFKK